MTESHGHDIINIIFDNYMFLDKKFAIILQASFLTRLEGKYQGIIFTIELKQKNRNINLNSNILRLIKFADIKKDNAQS